MLDFKIQLHKACVTISLDKKETVIKAMQAQQDAANNETKSSAGDKYETGRAMAHFEQEKLAIQFKQVSKQEKLLSAINPKVNCKKVESGSLVKTNTAMYYVAVGIGEVELNNQKVYVISPLAPLTQKILGLKAGDDVVFNKTKSKIEWIK